MVFDILYALISGNKQAGTWPSAIFDFIGDNLPATDIFLIIAEAQTMEVEITIRGCGVVVKAAIRESIDNGIEILQ